MATKPLTQTTGRRKEAVARARLRPGNGTHTINGKAFAEYFPTAMQRMTVTEALRVAGPDVVVSFGGGSTIDAAKAAMMLVTLGGRIDIRSGERFDADEAAAQGGKDHSQLGAERRGFKHLAGCHRFARRFDVAAVC